MSEKLKDYELWLEFELWDFESDKIDRKRDFFNMGLTLSNGRQYAFNVWTYGVFESIIETTKDFGNNLNGFYLEPPDLFIEFMDRESCERVVEDMIKQGTLPHTCRYHDPDEWEDFENKDNSSEPFEALKEPIALNEKRDYTLEWSAKFRLEHESDIPRLIAWLSRETKCGLDVLEALADEGCFNVHMQSVVTNVTAVEAFWKVNQHVGVLGAQSVHGPEVDEHIWRFEVFNPNPRGIPYLEHLSAKCDYAKSIVHSSS